MNVLLATLVSLWLAALCVTDLRSRRLPNALTLGGAAATLLLHAVVGGGAGVLDSLEGGAICAALLLLPFLLRAAGGGDVKMLFAIGCLFGGRRAVGCIFWTSVAGLALALAWFAAARIRRRKLDKAARRVPFGVAIAAGAWLEMLWPM